MIKYINLYLPISNKEIRIEISLPENYNRNMKCDTIYLLDGQNAFLDKNATFKRSIRATKHFDYISNVTNQNIIGIGIYNTPTEMGRINEYTPFKITNKEFSQWSFNDTSICHNFCDDLIKTIIPYIDANYNTTKNRYIYGSSLAAMTAIYLGYKYNKFKGIAAFSTATFICQDAVNDFINNNFKKSIKLFLYVGKKESSDGSNNDIYYNTSLDLYKLIKSKNCNVRLVVSEKGIHCEKTWESQLLDFLSFIYFDEIIYKY